MTDILMRRLQNEDWPQVRSLWMEAFADSEDVTNTFLQEIRLWETGFGAFTMTGGLVSMMFLIPAELYVQDQIAPCRYVYAVATAKNERNKGLMRRLHAFAATEAKAAGATALLLVPAEKSLFSLYQTLGYRTRFFLGEQQVVCTYNDAVTLAPCSSDQFLCMREELIHSHVISFDFSHEFRSMRYPLMKKTGASFWMVQGTVPQGYLCTEQRAEECVVLETNLVGQTLSDACGALAKQIGYRRILVVGTTGKVTPYGMILPFFSSKSEKIPFFIDAYMNLMLN